LDTQFPLILRIMSILLKLK